MNEHPDCMNEDHSDVARSLVEILHKIFSDLAASLSLLLNRIGENPHGPPHGDPIWDAAIRERAARDMARSKATESEWGKGMSDAERAKALDRWNKGITRVYNGDGTSEDFRYSDNRVKGDLEKLGADANAGEETDKDEADANVMEG